MGLYLMPPAVGRGFFDSRSLDHSLIRPMCRFTPLTVSPHLWLRFFTWLASAYQLQSTVRYALMLSV